MVLRHCPWLLSRGTSPAADCTPSANKAKFVAEIIFKKLYSLRNDQPLNHAGPRRLLYAVLLAFISASLAVSVVVSHSICPTVDCRPGWDELMPLACNISHVRFAISLLRKRHFSGVATPLARYTTASNSHCSTTTQRLCENLKLRFSAAAGVPRVHHCRKQATTSLYDPAGPSRIKHPAR